MLSIDPRTLKRMELLKTALDRCDGVELLPSGKNPSGAVRRGAIYNPPHKHDGDDPGPDILFWTDRHSTEVLIHSFEPDPYRVEVKNLVGDMREYLKTLGRKPEESAPIQTPDDAMLICDYLPIKIDGFHVRVLQSYVHMRQGIVITMDCLFPEKSSD